MGTVEDSEYPRVLSPFSKGPITQFVLEGKGALKSPEVPPDNVSLLACAVIYHYQLLSELKALADGKIDWLIYDVLCSFKH